MAEADDQFRAVRAHLVHHFLHMRVTDAKGVFREHPARIGNGHIGKGLPDHGDLHPAAFEEFIRFEQLRRFVPFGVEDVLAQGGEGQPLHQFGHTVRAQREFPVKGHRIGFQRVHHVHHVLACGAQAGERAVPCIAPIQQQGVGPVGADGVENGRHPVEPADLAIGACQRHEIVIGQRIIKRRAAPDPVAHAEILTRDMGHLSVVLTHADIDRRLAEVERFELAVNVGDMHQRDISECVELQQLVLIEAVLRGQPRPAAET